MDHLIAPLLAGVVLLAATPIAAQTTVAGRSSDESAVLAVDAHQREVVANRDVAGIGAVAHPNLRVNAPNNRVLTREDLMRMVGSGEIFNEKFTRTPEVVVVTGDVGVVMGSEVVYPAENSEQAQMYGRKTLSRRYTNVYVRENGVWLHLGRHANVITQ